MTNANITTQAIRVGLFFVLGLGLLWSLYETLSGESLTSHSGYSLEANFRDLQQLKVGDEVRLAGVRVGRVSETKLIDSKARATLFIEEPNKIPEGSVATITTAGLLGNNYIAIKASDKNQVYAPGSTIETQYTPDINAVIAQIGQIGDRLDSVFAGLQSFMGTGGEA
ncbi:MAG TPA: MlaD family protein, partial [Opitutales bacterium]|nr:MlaD family protein [Opitutales bacterium]